MEWRPQDTPALEFERYINSVVVPRPIAWISSVCKDGVYNLAPFSYFTVAALQPVILSITFHRQRDTLRNVLETGEFVVNICSAQLARHMVSTAVEHPPHIDEAALVGLATTPSETISVPRLAGARAAMECVLHSTHDIGLHTLGFGLVKRLFIDDSIMEGDRVSIEALAPVGRLSGANYCVDVQPFRVEPLEADERV